MKTTVSWVLFLIGLVGSAYWLAESSAVSVVIDGENLSGLAKMGYAAGGIVFALSILAGLLAMSVMLFLGGSTLLLVGIAAALMLLSIILAPLYFPVIALISLGLIAIKKMRFNRKNI